MATFVTLARAGLTARAAAARGVHAGARNLARVVTPAVAAGDAAIRSTKARLTGLADGEKVVRMRPLRDLRVLLAPCFALGCVAHDAGGGALEESTLQWVAADASVAESTDAGVRIALAPVYAQRVQSGEFAFPASALPPRDQSPAFTFAHVPASAKSLAVSFRDLDNQAVKWVIWNLSPTLAQLPPGISGRTSSPAQPAGAVQLGSVGNRGYAGPCCAERRYEWVLWALSVATLPSTRGLSTVQIHQQLLPRYAVARSEPVLMRIRQR